MARTVSAVMLWFGSSRRDERCRSADGCVRWERIAVSALNVWSYPDMPCVEGTEPHTLIAVSRGTLRAAQCRGAQELTTATNMSQLLPLP